MCEFVRKVFRIDVSAPFEVWQHADPCNSGNLLSGVGPSSKAASVSNVLHSFLLRQRIAEHLRLFELTKAILHFVRGFGIR